MNSDEIDEYEAYQVRARGSTIERAREHVTSHSAAQAASHSYFEGITLFFIR